MDLPSRLSAWLNSLRKAQEDAVRQDPAGQGTPMRLTLRGRRFKLELEIPRSERADDTEMMPAAAGEPDLPGEEAAHVRPVPPPPPDDTKPAAVGPPPSQTISLPAQGRPDTAASFWDALDPTEREALRSVASWRTFAAGARIMEEGERADHVMVILGGRAEIRVDANGNERVVAVRGLGQLVGELGALQVSVRSATVIALDMIWALVVQTKDFAAFISAHPRVLGIVQNQLDQRYAEDLTGYRLETRQGGFRAVSIDDTEVFGRRDENSMTGRSQLYSKPLNGENCTVFLTDVVGFGARTRTDSDRLLIREALFRMTQTAIRSMPGARSEDRGDGFLTVVPPEVPTARVIGQLVKELPVALEFHNNTQREPARFKLRLAVNVGPVVSDMGVSGEAIILTARLVDSPRFKEAVAGSLANLGVIASPFVYETVIRHGQDQSYVASYTRVSVEVKEFSTIAWMRLFDAPTASLVSDSSPPGFASGLLATLTVQAPAPAGSGPP